MNIKTLLEIALESTPHRRVFADITDEDIELALAWARNEINSKQASIAMGVKSGGQYPRLALGLKKAIMLKRV